MAMMISKFHRLIQSKILWGIFAIVISIAMVGLFSDIPNMKRASAQANSVGMLDGEPVPYNEFQHAYVNTRLQAALAFGQSLPKTEDVEERLRELAWKRVISLRQIRDMDIQVSDAEVLGGIQQQQIFHNEQGQFDTRIYAVFLNRFLVEQMGVGQKQFESYMREELAMTKLQRLVSQSILIAPAELSRAFRTVTDLFDVDYIEIPQDAEGAVTATKEEAEAFYHDNLEGFRSPEKAVVKYAAFSVKDAMADVEVTEDELLAYYNENLETYRIEEEETDETVAPEEAAEQSASAEAEAEATADTASTDPEVFDLTLPASDDAGDELMDSALPELSSLPEVADIKYEDFESVKSDIEDIVRRNKARQVAGEAATDFVLAVQDAAYNGVSFVDFAKEAGIELATTAPFSKREIPDGIDAGASFSRDAFDLGTDLTDSFSDPIDGRDTIYVMSLQEKIPSVIPGFADVEEEAIRYASRKKAADQLVEMAEALKEEFAAGVKDKDFADLAKAKGYDVTQLKEITAATGIPDSPYEQILFRGFLAQNQGEMTDLMPAEDRILLGYVRARAPAPAQSFTDYRPRIVQNLVRERAQRVFDAFQDHLLDKAAFSEKSVEEDTSDLSS